MARGYWRLKSDPDTYVWPELLASPKKTTCWDGVRNYQARNTMRDDMQVGDLVIFYHSGAKPPAAVGVAEDLDLHVPGAGDETLEEDYAWEYTEEHILHFFFHSEGDILRAERDQRRRRPSLRRPARQPHY